MLLVSVVSCHPSPPSSWTNQPPLISLQAPWEVYQPSLHTEALLPVAYDAVLHAYTPLCAPLPHFFVHTHSSMCRSFGQPLRSSGVCMHCCCFLPLWQYSLCLLAIIALPTGSNFYPPFLGVKHSPFLQAFACHVIHILAGLCLPHHVALTIAALTSKPVNATAQDNHWCCLSSIFPKLAIPCLAWPPCLPRLQSIYVSVYTLV